MSILLNEKCIACRRDVPRVTEAEIRELKPQVPDWALVERETIQRLERVFRFSNFAEALSFTNRVGSLAEAEGHHPDSHRMGSSDGDSLDAQDPGPPPERLHPGGKGGFPRLVTLTAFGPYST
jgi:Pterin 4 alpha carbinolamine dehydratase